MALSDIINKIEEEIKNLKDKISEADFNEVKQQFLVFKDASLKLNNSLRDALRLKLRDEDVQAKILDYKQNLLDATNFFASFITNITEKYQLSDTLTNTLGQINSQLNELVASFQQNFGQQLHSTVEALSHGFKAWVDAKPLSEDIQAINSTIESNLQKLKTWIRKE